MKMKYKDVCFHNHMKTSMNTQSRHMDFKKICLIIYLEHYFVIDPAVIVPVCLWVGAIAWCLVLICLFTQKEHYETTYFITLAILQYDQQAYVIVCHIAAWWKWSAIINQTAKHLLFFQVCGNVRLQWNLKLIGLNDEK